MFNNKYIDELVDERAFARASKDWAKADAIRNYLDTKNVFIFDTKHGQEVHYLTDKYFANKDSKIETMALSKRQYVELKIKQDISAKNTFDAWLFSVKSSSKMHVAQW